MKKNLPKQRIKLSTIALSPKGTFESFRITAKDLWVHTVIIPLELARIYHSGRKIFSKAIQTHTPIATVRDVNQRKLSTNSVVELFFRNHTLRLRFIFRKLLQYSC